MKRTVVRAGVSLLVGVVVSYAVAEGCAIRFGWGGILRTTSFVNDRASGGGTLHGFVNSTGGAELIELYWEANDAPKWFRQDFPKGSTALPPWASRSSENAEVLRQFGAGWPMRCVRCRVVYEDFNQPSKAWRSSGVLDVSRGPPDPDTWFTSRAAWTIPSWFPIAPWWPGLIVNTLFYALPVFIVWCAIPAVRRALRRKRGLCPACAYPRAALATDSPCPECGDHPIR